MFHLEIALSDHLNSEHNCRTRLLNCTRAGDFPSCEDAAKGKKELF